MLFATLKLFPPAFFLLFFGGGGGGGQGEGGQEKATAPLSFEN